VRTVQNPAYMEDIQVAMTSAPELMRSLGLDVDTLPESQVGAGYYARAFRLPLATSPEYPKGLVLKLTTDRDDAEASALIRDAGQVPGLVRVKDVWRIEKPVAATEGEERVPGYQPLYAIVSEWVDSASASGNFDVGNAGQLLDSLAGAYGSYLPEEIYPYLSESASGHPDIAGFLEAEGWGVLSTSAAMDYFEDLLQGWMWLSQHGFDVADLHAGNFGTARGRAVIFDFGHESAREVADVEIAVAANPASLLPNAAAALEMIHGTARAPQLLRSLGVARPRDLIDAQLGSGAYARAFITPSGKVLKLTTDPADAEIAELVRKSGGRQRGLVHVHDVRRLPREIMDSGEMLPLYAIVVDKVTPLESVGRYSEAAGWVVKLAAAADAVSFAAAGSRPGYDILAAAHDELERLYGEDPDERSAYLTEQAASYVDDLAGALRWVGAAGYRVRDLHDGNVGLDSDGNAVILDFGLSRTPGSETPPIEVAANPDDSILPRRFVVRPADQEATSQEVYDLFWAAWKTLGRQEEYMQDPVPPQVLWRGMEEAEYAATLGAGEPLQSRGDYSLSVEGTQFSDDPGTAEGYVNSGRSDPRRTGVPNYLVAVRGDVGTRKPDGYYESHGAVPLTAVLGVWRMGVEGGSVVAERVDAQALAPNPGMPKTSRVFDEAFDEVERRFPEVGTVELHRDELAGGDNGAGAERQFAYCMAGDPIVIAFAFKAEKLPLTNLRGLMRHEFGHALENRFGVRKLEELLGRSLPPEVERRADAIAEAVWGQQLRYDTRDIQCVGCHGSRSRPRRLPDEKASLKKNSDARYLPLPPIWEQNKAAAWDSGLTPQDLFNHYAYGDEYVEQRAAEDEDAARDVQSVGWWLEQFASWPRGSDVPSEHDIFLDRDGEIVDGYHRMTAATLAGYDVFPVTTSGASKITGAV